MWAVVENPMLVIEMSGRTARASTSKGQAGRILKVGQEFTFYVSNVKTDKLTISLVSCVDSAFTIMKIATYIHKVRMSFSLLGIHFTKSHFFVNLWTIIR